MHKYIVLESYNDDKEPIYVFPKDVSHLDFYTNYLHTMRKVVSAGYVSPGAGCYGRSKSLNLQAREVTDTKLLKGYK